MKFLFIFILASPWTTQAADGKSDFEIMMERNSKIKTRESEITLEGVKYKKVEYKNNTYYIAFAQPSGSQSDLNVVCARDGVLPFDPPARAEAQLQIVERNSLFIEGLKDACDGQKGAVIVPAVKLGLTIPDSKNSGIKDKKVYVDPLSKQLGFKGVW